MAHVIYGRNWINGIYDHARRRLFTVTVTEFVRCKSCMYRKHLLTHIVKGSYTQEQCSSQVTGTQYRE